MTDFTYQLKHSFTFSVPYGLCSADRWEQITHNELAKFLNDKIQPKTEAEILLMGFYYDLANWKTTACITKMPFQEAMIEKYEIDDTD